MRRIAIYEEFGVYHVIDAHGRESSGGSLPTALVKALAVAGEKTVSMKDVNVVSSMFDKLTAEVTDA